MVAAAFESTTDNTPPSTLDVSPFTKPAEPFATKSEGSAADNWVPDEWREDLK